MKWSIQEKDITFRKIYTSNIGAPKYVTQIKTDKKWESDNITIIANYFSTPLSPIDRLSKQKIRKVILVLNDTIDHLD